MTVREAIQSLLDSGLTNRKEIVKKAAEQAQVSKRHAYKTYRKMMPRKVTEQNDRPKIRKLKIASLVDQERLDHAKIVRAALEQFEADDCAYDDTLCRDLEISKDRWKDIRDIEEFLEYQILLPNKKRVWCLPAKRKELLKLDGVREV